MDSKDQYFIKFYNVDPKDLDENGRVTKAMPLLPLYGRPTPENTDYIGKTIDYEKDRKAPHLGWEEMYDPDDEENRAFRTHTNWHLSAEQYCEGVSA